MNVKLFRRLFIISSFFVFYVGAKSRPVQDPYIFGDAFRSLCQFILDNDSDFDPDLVRCGDLVFVQLDYLGVFFESYHPKITTKYILISHNHDMPAPGKFKNFLDDKKLFAWFTQNMDLECHPKLYPIPIGLLNLFHGFALGHLRLLDELSRNNRYSKNILCYANFNSGTNISERGYVRSLHADKLWIYWQKKVNYSTFISYVAQSKFVLCPHGGGLDCYRTWETLYLGGYPVVKTSTLDSLYTDLPVLIVTRWEDITQEFLEKKYEEICKKKYKLEKLSFEYWRDLIKKKQDECRC